MTTSQREPVTVTISRDPATIGDEGTLEELYQYANNLQARLRDDFVGLDIIVDVCDVLEAEFGSPYKATALLKRLVEAGYLGMKTGKGFYIYEKGKDPVVNPAVERYRIK